MEYRIEEDVNDKDVFEKNISRIPTDTIRLDNMPKGFKSIPHEWKQIHVDSWLALKKHLKNKYNIKGRREKVEPYFSSRGERRHVRMSNLYPPKKIVKKSAVDALSNSPSLRPAYIMQYKNKYFPFDLEDVTIAAIDIIQNNGLIGPCLVIDLSDSNRKDMGNLLGKTFDMERVFQFLEVPEAEEVKADYDVESDDNLTPKQIDLYRNPPDDESIDIGFKDSIESNNSIQRLDKLDNNAHKIRAAQFMINRLDGTLTRTKDPEKVKKLNRSREIWNSYKKSISKEFK
jgi:hypothetical protein